jgi:enoyl-CoA hydratase/carnithine racemase
VTSGYADKYAFANIERRGRILFVQLHTDGDSLVWDAQTHRQLPRLWDDIAEDTEADVVILTGAGDRFIGDIDRGSFGNLREARVHDRMLRESKHMLRRLLDIDALMISAVNGPITVHSEIPLLSDVVVASTAASFQEGGHFQVGGVPGDGMHALYPLWLGPNRARYFLTMGQVIGALEARDLGMVGEVVTPDDLLPRAWTIAERFALRSRLTVRYTRIAMTMQLKRLLNQDLQEGLLLERLARISVIDEHGDVPHAVPGEDATLPLEQQA